MSFSTSRIGVAKLLKAVSSKVYKIKYWILFSFISFLSISSVEISATPDKNKVYFYVFISKHCDYCQDMIDVYINPLKDNYPVEYQVFNLKNEKDFENYLKLTSKYHKEDFDMISVLIGDTFLGETLIKKSLEEKVLNALEKGGIDYPKVSFDSDSEEELISQFKRFTLIGIFGAGLIDGINPCSFSTIIFFISYLLFLNISRKKIFQIGIVFIVVSFFVYLGIGIGLFKTLFLIKAFVKYFFRAISVLLFLLGGVSLYDFYLIQKNRSKEMVLQLSKWQKSFIHQIIRRGAFQKHLILISIVISIIISLTEFTCTGQIYIPTIMYAIKQDFLMKKTLFILCIYNSGFILPFFMVFIAVYYGLSDKILARFFQKNTAIIKLIMASIFIIFGVILY